MKVIKRSWIIALTLLVLSCEKEIKFKGKGKDPVLVLNALVENDSLFTVYLEKSKFFLENQYNTSPDIETGAIVKVTNVNSGQEYVMTQSTIGNKYVFPFVVQSDIDFKIEVEHPDYPTISASTKTTKKVDLISVDTLSYIQNGTNYMRATLKWNDPSDENYYIIKLRLDQDLPDYGMQSNNIYFTSNDLSADNSTTTSDLDGTVYLANYLLVPDKLFNGQQKKLAIEMDNIFKYLEPGAKLTFQLLTMNKETYMYRVSVLKQENMDFFSEPVKIYSNIQNGFGIFGTLNYSEVVFEY